MTIKPGQAWGEPVVAPPDGAVVVHSDREISRVVDRRKSPPFVVRGGDIFKTLGGSAGMTFPIDVGEVLIDGRIHHFAAHLVMKEQGWRRFVVAMNAPWLGAWNLGPKAHLNDGVLDVSEFNLQPFEWRKVRARLLTGSHLPHPRIGTHRTKAMTFEFAHGASVEIDGEVVASAKHVAIRCVPDALTVVS